MNKTKENIIYDVSALEVQNNVVTNGISEDMRILGYDIIEVEKVCGIDSYVLAKKDDLYYYAYPIMIDDEQGIKWLHIEYSNDLIILKEQFFRFGQVSVAKRMVITSILSRHFIDKECTYGQLDAFVREAHDLEEDIILEVHGESYFYTDQYKSMQISFKLCEGQPKNTLRSTSKVIVTGGYYGG